MLRMKVARSRGPNQSTVKCARLPWHQSPVRQNDTPPRDREAVAPQAGLFQARAHRSAAVEGLTVHSTRTRPEGGP